MPQRVSESPLEGFPAELRCQWVDVKPGRPAVDCEAPASYYVRTEQGHGMVCERHARECRQSGLTVEYIQ